MHLYKGGDKNALEKLIEQNKNMIYKLANKFYVGKTNSIDIEDLQQEGFIGLIIAADRYKFDIENPCKFITYAVYWIYQKMNGFIKRKNTNEETSLNTPIGDDENRELLDCIEGIDYSFENVEDKLYNQQLRQELEGVIKEYNTLKEEEILKLRYGWDGNKCMTLEEVGEIFHVSGERIRQIEGYAMRKIRNTSWGILKAKELYTEKKNKSLYSVSNYLSDISFANKYLFDEVIE